MALKAEDVYGALTSYIDDTLKGAGALKGKNCTIKSIEKVAEGNKVTFEWTLDNGVKLTDSMIVEDGKDGADGENGADGYTPQKGVDYFDGEKGDKGDKGVGIESITLQGTSDLTDTYLILFTDGSTTTYDVLNGANITKTSQLQNDSEFITNATIGLINYYLKDEVYNKAKIDELLRNVGAGLSVKIVPSLPIIDISPTTIYLINTSGSQYNQYMYIDGDWASLGSTSVDLSSYYNKTQIDTMLLGYVTSSILLTQLMSYTKTADLAKVATSNDYNDLDNLPVIPDVSGIKPYSNELVDSVNSAPTSKVVYDAVQKINEELAKKLEESDLEDYAKKDDIPTDYITEDDLEPYAKSEDVPKIDDTSTTAEDKVWSAKKINDSLVDYYSTTETKTNKVWIDGKPIYRKTVISEEDPFGIRDGYDFDKGFRTQIEFPTIADNINEPTNFEILYRRSQWTEPLPHVNDNDYSVFLRTMRGKNHSRPNTCAFEMYIPPEKDKGAEDYVGKLIITIEYTKTTD